MYMAAHIPTPSYDGALYHVYGKRETLDRFFFHIVYIVYPPMI